MAVHIVRWRYQWPSALSVKTLYKTQRGTVMCHHHCMAVKCLGSCNSFNCTLAPVMWHCQLLVLTRTISSRCFLLGWLLPATLGLRLHHHVCISYVLASFFLGCVSGMYLGSIVGRALDVVVRALDSWSRGYRFDFCYGFAAWMIDLNSWPLSTPQYVVTWKPQWIWHLFWKSQGFVQSSRNCLETVRENCLLYCITNILYHANWMLFLIGHFIQFCGFSAALEKLNYN